MTYPGGLSNWELLWAQNLVFVLVQFTTGATLYTQNRTYSAFVTAPARAVSRWAGRSLLVAVHVLSGLVLIGLNLAFVWSWLGSQPRPIPALVAARPAIALSTFLLTGALLLMGLLGVSLYANLRPDTVFPVWSFEYALSRKLHRALFIVVVGVLGYHVFFIPRVSLVWTAWVADGEPFGAVVLILVAVWGLLAGQSVLMAGEWLTGNLFSRWESDYSAALSGAGVALALALAAGLVLTDLGPGALLAVMLSGVAALSVGSRFVRG